MYFSPTSRSARSCRTSSAPSFGRFLEADPLGYEDSPNLYAYVLNDPVNQTDPLGLTEEDIYVYGFRKRNDSFGPLGGIFATSGGLFRGAAPSSSPGEGTSDGTSSNSSDNASKPKICVNGSSYSTADAMRDVGSVVSDIGSVVQVGGLIAVAAAPPVGGAVTVIGRVTSAAGQGLEAWGNYLNGNYGAVAGNVLSAAVGAKASSLVGKLGSGASRNPLTGRFAANPLGGRFRDAKTAVGGAAAGKITAIAAKAIQCPEKR